MSPTPLLLFFKHLQNLFDIFTNFLVSKTHVGRIFSTAGSHVILILILYRPTGMRLTPD